MEKIITALEARKKAPARLTRNSKLFKTILEAIKEKKGDAVVSLNLKKIDEAVADFFILCEAQTHIQIKTISDHITDEVWKKCNEKPYHKEQGAQWTLIDYVNIVVHIFNRDDRKFYDLEGLWADAERMEHND